MKQEVVQMKILVRSIHPKIYCKASDKLNRYEDKLDSIKAKKWVDSFKHKYPIAYEVLGK